jgi:hypothetical protein
MDRERVAVLGGPLMHVHDVHADPLLVKEQRGDQADGARAHHEHLRIGVTKH